MVVRFSGGAGALDAAGGGAARCGLCRAGSSRSFWIAARRIWSLRSRSPPPAAGMLAAPGNDLGVRHPLICAALHEEICRAHSLSP